MSIKTHKMTQKDKKLIKNAVFTGFTFPTK